MQQELQNANMVLKIRARWLVRKSFLGCFNQSNFSLQNYTQIKTLIRGLKQGPLLLTTSPRLTANKIGIRNFKIGSSNSSTTQNAKPVVEINE
jgi:hypothetical protein